eukprot:2719978-Rhodomonas_salina.1
MQPLTGLGPFCNPSHIGSPAGSAQKRSQHSARVAAKMVSYAHHSTRLCLISVSLVRIRRACRRSTHHSLQPARPSVRRWKKSFCCKEGNTNKTRHDQRHSKTASMLCEK